METLTKTQIVLLEALIKENKLEFKDRTVEVKVVDGAKKTHFIPSVRPLKVSDIISFKESDTEVTFVTAAGNKYTFSRLKEEKGGK